MLWGQWTWPFPHPPHPRLIEGWSEGPWPKGMDIVLEMDCNPLLIPTGAASCPGTAPWTFLSSRTHWGDVVSSHMRPLCLEPLITSLRLEAVWSLSHRPATLHALPCDMSYRRPGHVCQATGWIFWNITNT